MQDAFIGGSGHDLAWLLLGSPHRPIGRISRGHLCIPARSQCTIAAVPPPGKRAKFVAEAKDLESDESIWPLYERWCVAFGQERGRDEMTRRFGRFKDTVLMVDETNRADLTYKLGINDMADGKLRELRGMKIPLSYPGVDKRRIDMAMFSHDNDDEPNQPGGSPE